MTKKTTNKILNKGHMVYGVNTVSDYIKKDNGQIINVTKIATGFYKVWGEFNNMTPFPMVESEILALC